MKDVTKYIPKLKYSITHLTNIKQLTTPTLFIDLESAIFIRTLSLFASYL